MSKLQHEKALHAMQVQTTPARQKNALLVMNSALIYTDAMRYIDNKMVGVTNMRTIYPVRLPNQRQRRKGYRNNPTNKKLHIRK